MRPKGAKFDTPVGVRVVVGASGASINAAFRRPLWCLRHHLSPLFEGALWTLNISVIWLFIAAVVKNHTTALTGAGNAPLLSPSATSPPEGEMLVALCIE